VRDVHRSTLKLVVETVNEKMKKNVSQREVVKKVEDENKRQHADQVRTIA
jgi:hypothetical protein